MYDFSFNQWKQMRERKWSVLHPLTPEIGLCLSPFSSIFKIDHMGYNQCSRRSPIINIKTMYANLSAVLFMSTNGRLSVMSIREGGTCSVAEFTAINSVSRRHLPPSHYRHKRLHSVLSEDKWCSPTHYKRKHLIKLAPWCKWPKRELKNRAGLQRKPSFLGLLGIEAISSGWLGTERLTMWSTSEVEVRSRGGMLTLVTDAGQMWLMFTVSSFIPTVKKWLLKSAWSCRRKTETVKKHLYCKLTW